MRKFCAKCGRPGDFKEFICEKCRPKKVNARKDRPVCKYCQREKHGKRWGNE